MLRQALHAILTAIRILTKKYYPEELEVISKFISKDSICIDIGAHLGYWSVPLSKICTQGLVVSFEALPYYAEVLKTTLKLLGKANIKVFNLALANTFEIVNMKWKSKGKRLTGLTHISINNDLDSEIESVVAVKLDVFEKLLDSKVSFIKCDVEGFELMVFRGAQKILEAYRPVIYTELNYSWCKRYNYTPADVIDFLKGFDYAPFIIIDKSIQPLKEVDFFSGDILFLQRNQYLMRS